MENQKAGSTKERYRNFCRGNDQIPLFSKDWWLDAVCGDVWDAVLVEKDGQIVASLPYCLTRKYGMILLGMPPLTPTLGPWIHYPSGQKTVTRLSYEKDLMGRLISGLPVFSFFYQNFHPTITNWLPFYWNRFTQTTKYTYTINELNLPDAVFSGFRENIRGDIRKASKTVRVIQSDDVEAFYTINSRSFSRQGLTTPYSADLVRKIDRACVKRQCRKIFFAEDLKGLTHAAVYIVWGGGTAYYLMGGGDPELRHSGATSLLLWEALRFSASVAKVFDFEGSMMEPVERFFRAFGATPTPYHSLRKVNSRFLLLNYFARQFFSKR